MRIDDVRQMSAAGAGTAGSARGRFDGVLQILRFNYPMFTGAALLGVAGGLALRFATMPWLAHEGMTVGLGLLAVWTFATLAACHLVYDRYAIFNMRWMPAVARDARRWANIHAGFDQTTVALRQAMPRARGVPVDLFDPEVMTERSIHRVRAHSRAVAGTVRGRFDRLPLESASLDVVFMLFAAHELRRGWQRAALFKEAARVLVPGGAVILVEHVREPVNALVFGPGVFHFHSRHEWLRAGDAAGLGPAEETSLTPFASLFVWRRRP